MALEPQQDQLRITDKNSLKQWFKRGLKPLEAHFWAWLDSFWHKNDLIPITSVQNLRKTLDSKSNVEHIHVQYTTPAIVQSMIDNQITSIYRLMSPVATYADLPMDGNLNGDVRNVSDTGMNYVWDGTEWDALGGLLDLTNYVTQIQFTTALSDMATQTWVNQQLANVSIDLSNYYTAEEVRGKLIPYATQEWVNQQIANSSGGGGGGMDLSLYALKNATGLSSEHIAAWRTQLGVTEGGGTVEDIVSDYNIGSVKVGDLIPAGTTTQGLASVLFTGTFTPDLIAPSLSLSHNAGSVREIGESVQIILTANFNRGDIRGAVVNGVWSVNASQGARAGVAISYEFNGLVNGVNTSKTITHVVASGNNNFSAKVNYAASTVQPKNNKGENFSSPLAAGSLTASVSFLGRYQTFFGNSNGSTPARSLPQKAWANVNTMDLTATMGINYYDIYVVATKQLVSVVDVEIGNVDITNAYTDKGLVTVNDAGGNAVSYRKYQLYNAQPYSDKNHTHKITLKDL
ncbi:hypothetical protein [Faecalibacter macacae]|uniref:Uncharacterized protein n=1 Tax=Faecalibacter macacae TaxID=1859289 RepID=A0A3L9M736_9FLAO|nr:hypothetical protein [Faecalibacter macacae]RLZ08611.1 hypothetical protein EAH69_09870 [Faecalibacter macacae]